jgi:hypothetical protein
MLLCLFTLFVKNMCNHILWTKVVLNIWYWQNKWKNSKWSPFNLKHLLFIYLLRAKLSYNVLGHLQRLGGLQSLTVFEWLGTIVRSKMLRCSLFSKRIIQLQIYWRLMRFDCSRNKKNINMFTFIWQPLFLIVNPMLLILINTLA